MRPFISIVVPTFDRRGSLRRLLDGIGAQTVEEPFEVLVVDDGSTDGTREMLATLDVGFNLRHLAQAHAGPAAARNLAVAEARGDLIMFLDDDVVPEPGLLQAHVKRHDESSDLVVCGPMLPPESGRRPVWIRWEEEKLLRQYRALEEGQYVCTYRQFYTANASVRRDRLLAAGGFDTTFTRAEDVDLGYRLHRLGLRFVFAPDARVRHYPIRTFAAWRRVPYQYGRADVEMQRRKAGPSLNAVAREFHSRHFLIRLIVRACLGKRRLLREVSSTLGLVARASDSIRLRVVALAALSALYHLEYWQGVSDALDAPAQLREALEHRGREAMVGLQP